VGVTVLELRSSFILLVARCSLHLSNPCHSTHTLKYNDNNTNGNGAACHLCPISRASWLQLLVAMWRK